jgi:hypothetical protein
MFLTKNVFKPRIWLFVNAVICKKQVGNCVIRFYILYKSGFDYLMTCVPVGGLVIGRTQKCKI